MTTNTTLSPPTSPHTLINQELEDLATSHGLYTRSKRSRKRALVERNIVEEFSNDTPKDAAFHRLAHVVCKAGCIPRKELYEAWAMALYVQTQFRDARRLADLAAGHGLLAWALLWLDECDDNDLKEKKKHPRSVACIDRCMPVSAETLRDAMLDEWPHWHDRFDYVEGPLEGIRPHSSTVLVGVHCCATLTDKILDLALLEGSSYCPLALVPCCHAKKCLWTASLRQDWYAQCHVVGTTEPPPPLMGEDTKNTTIDSRIDDDMHTNEPRDTATKEAEPNQKNTNQRGQLLTSFLDAHRILRLRQAGFIVYDDLFIPQIYTPKNRVILAQPPSPASETVVKPCIDITETTEASRTSATLLEKARHMMGTKTVLLQIPVADIPVARATVRMIAGRAMSIKRKERYQRNIDSHTFGISLYYYPSHSKRTASEQQDHKEEDDVDDVTSIMVKDETEIPPPARTLSLEQLQTAIAFAGATVDHVRHRKQKDNTILSATPPFGDDDGMVVAGPHWLHKSQCYSQSYRITYPGLNKAQAKVWHAAFGERLLSLFPGQVSIRNPGVMVGSAAAAASSKKKLPFSSSFFGLC